MVLQYLARYFTLAWVDLILFSLSPSLVFSSPPRSFVTSLAFNKQRTLGLWRIFFILNIDKVTTTIGCGSPNKANLYSVHGSALDAKEVDATRKNLGWPWEPFYVPKDVNKHWSRHVPDGAALETEWNAKFADYEMKYEEEAAELKSISTGELPAGWEKALLTYTPENPTDATRNLSQQCLNALTKVLPEFQI